MLKTLLVSVALVSGASTFAFADPSLQMGRSVSEPMAQPMMHRHMMPRTKKVLANGRCNGRSYGTGQRGCGSATGGPAGGNPSRN